MITISKSRNQTRPLTATVAKQLLIHNMHVNGSKALIYSHGLSASRYVEYAGALAFLSVRIKRGDAILEVGCGHSILPTFWQKLRIRMIVLDTNRNALKWQIRKSKETANTIVDTVLADMRCLPFKDQSIIGVSCVSALEHIPDKGDTETASEIGRTLKVNGLCVISIPLSLGKESYFEQHWAAEIPSLVQTLFWRCLPAILSKLQVDRTSSYFERFFSLEDVHKRIIIPSKCIKQYSFALKSGQTTKLLHQKIIPQGSLTILEYLIAKSLQTSKRTRNADALVVGLKKGTP